MYSHFRNPQRPPGRMFTDVTLVCKDGKPPAAHNGILTSTSPFFMNILKRTSILIHLQSSHSPSHCILSVALEGFLEMALHCIHFAGQNSYCQSMTWPIMTMTRLRLIFPCIICEKIISAQGLVINHLKNIHVVLVLACMLCGNTSWCLSPPIEHITSVHVLPFQPSGRKLNLRLCHDNIYCSIPQHCLFDNLTMSSTP